MWFQCKVTNNHKWNGHYGVTEYEILYSSHFYSKLTAIWRLHCEVTVSIVSWYITRSRYNDLTWRLSCNRYLETALWGHRVTSLGGSQIIAVWRHHCEVVMTVASWKVRRWNHCDVIWRLITKHLHSLVSNGRPRESRIVISL